MTNAIMQTLLTCWQSDKWPKRIQQHFDGFSSYTPDHEDDEADDGIDDTLMHPPHTFWHITIVLQIMT